MSGVGIIVGLIFVFMVGLAVSFPFRRRLDLFDRTMVSFAFGCAALTLTAFLTFLLFEKINFLLSHLIFLPLIAFLWKERKDLSVSLPSPIALWRNLSFLERLALIMAACSFTIVLFRALHWPFYAGDALFVWANRGRDMYITGEIPLPLKNMFPGQSMGYYPVQIPMLYSLVAFWEGGWNETTPKIMNSMFYALMLAAGFRLGERVGGKSTGSLTVIALTLTPLMTRFAYLGYADLPLAFFYAAAAYFALRTLEDGNSYDLFLCGTMAGIGAWTKFEGLFMAGVLFILLFTYLAIERKATLHMAATFLLGTAVFTLPWYVFTRGTLFTGGPSTLLVPTVDVQRIVAIISAGISLPGDLDLPLYIRLLGYVVIVCILFAAALLLRRRDFVASLTVANLVLVLYIIYSVPYPVDWFMKNSGPRLLLHIYPLVCVLATATLVRHALPRVQAMSPLIKGGATALLLLSFYPVSSGQEIVADAFAIKHLDASIDDKLYYRLGKPYAPIMEIKNRAERGSTILIMDKYDIAHYLLSDYKVVPPTRNKETERLLFSIDLSERMAGVDAEGVDFIAVMYPEIWEEEYAMFYSHINESSFTTVWQKQSPVGIDYTVFRRVE